MKITKVMVNRKFFLGNFETLDMAAEAELSEQDNPLEVWQILRDNIEMQYISMGNKKSQAPPPMKDPQPKQETTKPTVNDPLVCACGAPKKPNFNQCYLCWEKARVPK